MSLIKVVPSVFEYRALNYPKKIIYRSRSTSEKPPNRPIVIEADVSSNLSSDDLVEPTNCCMSGCTNCVWIQYAEKLSEKLTNSSDEVQKILLNKVTDPNMKAFLLMELRCRNLIK